MSSPDVHSTPQPQNDSAEQLSAESQPPAPKLEGEALENALRQQLEFYFSKQNLQQDTYLISQMNAQKWVSVEVIANFRKVKSLTEDRDLLVRVMRTCKNLVVDETGSVVRPNIKMERTTLILRDIPSSTPPEEIKQILSTHEKYGDKVVSVRPDFNDTWFVTFDNEEACTEVALWLPTQNFQGKPIACRVKSENLLRGFYYTSSREGGQGNANPAGQYRGNGNGNGQYNNGYYYSSGYAPYTGYVHYGQYQQGINNKNASGAAQAGGEYKGRRAPGSNRKGRKGANDSPSQAAQSTDSMPSPISSPTSEQSVGSPSESTGASSPSSGQKDQRSNKKKVDGKKKRSSGQDGTITLNFGPEHFPALPRKSLPTGYAGDFKTYTREQFASIVADLAKTEYAKPAAFPNDPENAIINTAPLKNTQLLDPFPLIYPASPSPMLSAQPRGSFNMPSLDLGGSSHPSIMPGPLNMSNPSQQAKRSSLAAPQIRSLSKSSSQPSVAGQSAAAAARPASAVTASGQAAPKAKAGKPSKASPNKGKGKEKESTGKERRRSSKQSKAEESSESAHADAASSKPVINYASKVGTATPAPTPKKEAKPKPAKFQAAAAVAAAPAASAASSTSSSTSATTNSTTSPASPSSPKSSESDSKRPFSYADMLKAKNAAKNALASPSKKKEQAKEEETSS